MWIVFLLGLTSGLVTSSWASSVEDVKMRSCSYYGVFQIQGKNRYSLNFEDAQKLCEVLGASLATYEKMSKAFNHGMETCRYGWIRDGNISIPRQVPNELCARNLTGTITMVSPLETKYDAYCFDSTDLSPKNCTHEKKYVGNDTAYDETSEYATSEGLNQNEIPSTLPSMVDPLDSHISSTVTLQTEITHTEDEMNKNPIINDSHHEKHIPSTQPPSTTTKSTLANQNPDHSDEVEKNISIMPTLDTLGSGMGETTYTTTSEVQSEEPKETQDNNDDVDDTANEPNEYGAVNPDQSVRQEPDKASAPEDNSNRNSHSNSDWLVILLVVVAIAAIILLAVLIVTRNRWCGKSQTLMITSKSSSEGNGTAASAASPQAQEREQEMVTLMNKEKIQENGNTEEFTVITLEESPDKTQQA